MGRNKKPNTSGIKKHQFVKGDPRINRKGRPHKLPNLTEVLAKYLGEESKGTNATEKIIAALRKKAYYGDKRAAELLLDRAFGKVQQSFSVDTKLEVVTPIVQVIKNEPTKLANDETQIAD